MVTIPIVQIPNRTFIPHQIGYEQLNNIFEYHAVTAFIIPNVCRQSLVSRVGASV